MFLKKLDDALSIYPRFLSQPFPFYSSPQQPDLEQLPEKYLKNSKANPITNSFSFQ
jgi:hypothetical protein